MIQKSGHRRGWGQHFLVDSKVRERIVLEAELSSRDAVVEIGVGEGFLTEVLLREAGWVVGFEIDPALTSLINEKFATYPNFSFYPEDFLKIDLKKHLILPVFPAIKCVSNLPYSASTPILLKLFTEEIEWKLLLLMVQREFGDKVLSFPPHGKGSLVSLAAHLRFTVQKVFSVTPSAFRPNPKVESVVLKFSPREDQIDPVMYRKIIILARFLFTQKRKSLLSRLEETMESREKALEILEKAEILPHFRAENLDRSQWIALTTTFEEKTTKL
ncbi:MAG: 16S rRNA (adenine(1518)-N(6)/adenine(1519)-N(6))-dimethyltransferase RsmA [Atribacterota bacterium]|nr:16S rRNA (adenine(1518)-N(6)/adenine(1519)-N(6))-dimethyltransferase RsmA [Atribacterota bacterium]